MDYVYALEAVRAGFGLVLGRPELAKKIVGVTVVESVASSHRQILRR